MPSELPRIWRETAEKLRFSAAVKARAGGGVALLKNVRRTFSAISENKTYDYYKSQEVKATYDAERGFYQALAAEEREHHSALLDYYEYLKDPAGWFVKKEHPSLDGG